MTGTLRSKFGCTSCRSRRKKCDERKPRCGLCTRLGLRCERVNGRSDTLNTPSARVQRLTTQVVDRIPIERQPQGQSLDVAGYQPFRNDEQFRLTMQTAQVYGVLVSVAADPEFHDTSRLIMFAIQNPNIRDALASFSAHMLQDAIAPTAQLDQTAVGLYNRALSTVSKYFTDFSTAYTIEALTAITFLGITESLGTGNVELAKIHFLAAASICKVLRPRDMHHPFHLMLYRVAVECWLYNLATSAIFYKDCDPIIENVEWTVLDEAFGSTTPLDTRSYSLSPHLGGNHAIFKLMLLTTCYARQPQVASCRAAQVAAWSSELDFLESQLFLYFDYLEPGVAETYYTKYQLCVYALRIILEKIRDHSALASSPRLMVYIVSAKDLLRSRRVNEPSNPLIAWPLMIFIMASHTTTAMQFFISTIEQMHENFDAGHTKRLQMAISLVRERRLTALDALDLLLEKSGLAGTQR